jgi:hypothetical protein
MIEWKKRYLQAYLEDFQQRYPETWASRETIGYPEPKYPAVVKANGLTAMICNFLNWKGHRATRINTMGRKIGTGITVTESGLRLKTDKFIKSSTRKGTADVSATIKGKSVMFEVKAGKDKPSEDQLKEQAKERRAGGIYEFIYCTEDFFKIYDQILGSTLF